VGRAPTGAGTSCDRSEVGRSGMSRVRRSLLVIGRKAEGVARVEDVVGSDAMNGVPTRASVCGSVSGREVRRKMGD
jgi:hypothetical protein